MMHIVAAKVVLNAIGLLVAEVDTPQKAEAVRAILFESPEGEVVLTAMEKALGVTLAPTEVVAWYWECGPLSVEVRRDIRIVRELDNALADKRLAEAKAAGIPAAA